MQIIHQDENEGSSSGKADSMGIVIYIERIGRYLEGKHVGRLGRMIIRIQEHWGVFDRYKERIWKKR